MRPSFPHTVTLKTPGTARIDPVTRNELPGPVTTVTSPAYLAAHPVSQLRSQFEVTAEQDTTVQTYDLLLPPGTTLTTHTQVIDEAGSKYIVSGRPVQRPHRNPVFVAATLRLVSDIQD